MENFVSEIDQAFSEVVLHAPRETFFIMVLMFLRLIPSIISIPILSGKAGPNSMRLVFSMCLIAILLPYVCNGNAPRFVIIPSWGMIGILIVRELTIGSFIAFAIGLPFTMIQGAGIISDNARGASSMIGSDPLTKDQSSPTGSLYASLVIAIFLNNHDLTTQFFKFFVFTFTSLPVFDLENPLSLNYLNHLVTTAPQLFERGVVLSCQLSCPILLSSLVIDVGMSLIGKTAPQMQISFISTAFKSLSGSFILLVIFSAFMGHLETVFLEWSRHLTQHLFPH